MKRIIVSLLLGGLILSCGRAAAWGQETHRQINYEAMKIFHDQFADEEKFQLGPIGAGYDEIYKGIAVKSSCLFVDPYAADELGKYEIGEDSHTLLEWVVLGGDWADEPHLYASVRHFYDPLKLSGQHYLTDQSSAHGQYDSPQIDAVTWGLNHRDNPFSLRQALSYYKQALEIPEGAQVHWPLIDHFKANLPLTPANLEELRGMYLAMAYRALGESMHMLGDMTQPAHTRNDSHPIDEPIEGNIFGSDVEDYARSPVAEEIGQLIASAQGQLLAPRELFHQVALFTNQNFFSADTIYDEPQGVHPQNWETPYPSPQFKDLQCETFTVSTFQGEKEAYKFTANLAGSSVPMAQSRLSLHWFEPAPERVQKIAELAVGQYHIPPSFAKGQGQVLLPIATHAAADLAYLFFPTLELIAQYDEPVLQEKDAQGKRIIAIDAEMVHHQEKDFAWQDNDLEIHYSGPGQLVFEKKGKVVQTRELQFLEGKVERQENHEGDMVKAPLRVYVKDKKTKLSKEESYYAAEVGTTIYLQIEAGSRIFKSAPHLIAKQAVNLRLEPTIAVGEPGAYFDFRALVSPEDDYRYDWDFGDGHIVADGGPEQGYTYPKEGNFTVTVKLYDDKGDFLAEDSSSAAVADEGLIERLQGTDELTVWLFYESGSHPDDIRTDNLVPVLGIKPIWAGSSFSYTDIYDSPGVSHRSILVSGSIDPDSRLLSMDYEFYEVLYDNESYTKFSIRNLPYEQNIDTDYNIYDYFTANISQDYITDFERWEVHPFDKVPIRYDRDLDFSIEGEVNVEFMQRK